MSGRGSIKLRYWFCQLGPCTKQVVRCFFPLIGRVVEYDSTMGQPRPLSESQRWFWIATIWLGIGLFDATQTVFVMRAEGMHHAWIKLFATLLLSWIPWAFATPVVLRLGRRFPAARWRSLSTWIMHFAACTVIALAFSAWMSCMEVWLNPWATSPPPGPFFHHWQDRFYNGVLSYLILYGGVLLVGYLLDFGERLALQQTETARLNEQLSKAQLNALRRQIEPHFLFNTLNAIAGLVREKRNDAAVDMIAGLSDLLRRVVEDSDRQQVPLREELEFAQTYLDIQKVRFADRLQVSVDVPKELFLAEVPSLILQPLVENAVKHGIAKRVQGGAIRINASRSNGTLTVRVYNDGPGLAAGWDNNRTGVGISNVRTRLQNLYGDEFELSIQNRSSGGVEASVSVPFISPPVVTPSLVFPGKE
jgi:two-component system, LytTR family, sensor kinase